MKMVVRSITVKTGILKAMRKKCEQRVLVSTGPRYEKGWGPLFYSLYLCLHHTRVDELCCCDEHLPNCTS